LSDAPESAHLDLLAVASRVPGAIVCLESALAIHELVDDIPSAAHIAVARGRHVPKIEYPVVVVYRFDPVTFDLGVGTFEAAPGESVRVYGRARSVVDAMRLRHRIGADLAMHALGRYVRTTGQRGVAELLEFARRLNVEGPIRSAVEAVLA
jgi:predicted transcriptional regulator of viral defense system